MNTKIRFINHASITIECSHTVILCDPWYEGDAFNGGWNLLFENKPSDIEKLLENVNYIWISHEHPDHFSIRFFNRYKGIIQKNNIQILFQKTKDKRVINYLKSCEFTTQEIPFNTKVSLAPLLNITLIKDGFYDSALLVDHQNEKILNLNDCEINTIGKAKKISALTGSVDVLLTQFSYAAWKGGVDNLNWRKKAAEDKIAAIKMQVDVFKPEYVIPFASYVYFSNELNFYLNDSINTPKKVYEALGKSFSNIIILKPNDTFNANHFDNKSNIEYWDTVYKNLDSLNKLKYQTFNFNEIQSAYESYRQRIRKNNNIYLMLFFKKLKVFKVFNPVKIYIEDLNMTVLIDIFSKHLSQTNSKPDLTMPSASLHFLLKNSFGFDTLTVNGCFEEARKNGFIDSTKTLAIENLNNLGISFSLKLIFNLSAIKTFITRLSRIRAKMEVI
jgi:hypothetical protein